MMGAYIVLQLWYHNLRKPALVAGLVVCPLRTGGHRFDPGLGHTKVIKNGTSCPAWHSGLWGRARTGRPSVRIM